MILGLSSWGGLLSQPVLSAPESPRLLTVTGQGRVQVETSVAVIHLGVLVEGDSAQAVQMQVARQSEQLVERLRQLQVDKLQTTGISLNPRYDYSGDQPVQRGVQGQNSVQFEVPVEEAGGILDEAIAAGATQVQSISFKASEEVLKTARGEALRAAVADAQAQASVVLEALNLTQEGIQEVQVNSEMGFPPPMPLESTVAYARSSDATTPVIGGEQEVGASVTLKISY